MGKNLLNQDIMDIYAEPGSKVVYMYPNNGYEHDQLLAYSSGLRYGEVYTVTSIEVGDSRSYASFQEQSGRFNTAMFAPAESVSEQERAEVAKTPPPVAAK